ncbi:Uncharacterised protein [Helicobacter cinaedi]|nr:hypothetical protein [Helicobacter cinaedi]STP14240.1 Uncharacterised protein [Helicobacter cinaedi]
MEPITSKDNPMLQKLPGWYPKITLKEGFKMMVTAKNIRGGGQNRLDFSAPKMVA